jgi:D-3-phosphoglycerate dehydrogenase
MTGEGGARYSVLVSDKVSPAGLEPLTMDERFEVEMAGEWRKDDPDRFLELLERAQGLVVRSGTRVDRDFLAGAPCLRVVGRAGVGVDNIDMAAATERGIAVLNAPAGNTISAAELTLALMLSTVRRIPAADRSVREGAWTRGRFAGLELRGKTLGLVGAGRIGSEVARRARGFGMTILAYDPFLSDERARDVGVEPVELEELLARADVVSLHVPLTDSTRGMMGPEEMAAMKAGAFLINVARGGVVDEDALASALEKGELGGAALDVYAQEPLPDDSRLRQAPNLVLTPHLGASTAEAQELVAREIAVGVRDALSRGDLTRSLNAPAVGGEELQRLRPLLELGRRLGRLGCALAPGGIEGVEVAHAGPGGEVLRAVGSWVVVGLLGAILGEDQVNVVNAGHLASVRGIDVSTRRLAHPRDYTEYLEVLVRSEAGNVELAGALMGESHPRIVRIDGYHVDVTPRGTLLVLRNRDVPGVIGRVGSLLGSMGLNIAEYHQARMSEGGDAVATVALDGQVDRSLTRSLLDLPEIRGAWVVDLS